jgi:hypothetical protein
MRPSLTWKKRGREGPAVTDAGAGDGLIAALQQVLHGAAPAPGIVHLHGDEIVRSPDQLSRLRPFAEEAGREQRLDLDEAGLVEEAPQLQGKRSGRAGHGRDYNIPAMRLRI